MTCRELQETVQEALDWEPGVDAAEIGVSVEDSVVTLRGEVKTYAQRAAAERVAFAVYGVKAVANDLDVHPDGSQRRTDSEIAQAVLEALRWNTAVPDERISVRVSRGWVTLQGTVDWAHQRAAAANAVKFLAGVRGIANSISVTPRMSAADVKTDIEEALRRSAEVDARRVNVDVSDSRVTLTGSVHSWFERDEARRAAWSAPGVREVVDEMVVTP